MITLRFDGLFRCLTGDCPDNTHSNQDPRMSGASSSGVMCYGWLIYDDNRLVARGHGGFVRREEASSNIAEYLALFLIVLLHEFGHSLACRQVGGTANEIVLWPLGEDVLPDAITACEQIVAGTAAVEVAPARLPGAQMVHSVLIGRTRVTFNPEGIRDI